MTKLIVNINQTPPVASAPKSAALPQPKEHHNPTTAYKITDRVTISNEAKLMSRQYANVITDDSASPILSYEIRKPFAFHGSKKNNSPDQK